MYMITVSAGDQMSQSIKVEPIRDGWTRQRFNLKSEHQSSSVVVVVVLSEKKSSTRLRGGVRAQRGDLHDNGGPTARRNSGVE